MITLNYGQYMLIVTNSSINEGRFCRGVIRGSKWLKTDGIVLVTWIDEEDRY